MTLTEGTEGEKGRRLLADLLISVGLRWRGGCNGAGTLSED